MSGWDDWDAHYRLAYYYQVLYMPSDERLRPVKNEHWLHIIKKDNRKYLLIWGGGADMHEIPKERILGRFQTLKAAKAAYRLFASTNPN
jgi:hypothetical protein